ncbi:MAG: serine/threonine protein kinase [Deltaproteobacteria bacterium]|nr:serine/threonine protein kinase [Deltaproteobacteria bacterium]
MNPAELQDALATLAAALSEKPQLDEPLRNHWRVPEQFAMDLPDDVRAAAGVIAADLPALTYADDDGAGLRALFDGPGAEVLLAWCSASAWRRDAWIAPILDVAATQDDLKDQVAGVASQRVVSGPLQDALACAPLMGDGGELRLPANAEARARLEILFWEAGASALEVPSLGAWIWGSQETFRVLIGEPSHGALRGRVLAARCLEVSVCGMSATTDPELVGWTLEVLQPLLLHPEPLVWVHAAPALGRLTGTLEQLEGMLLDWVHGDSPVLRQRGITAFASVPAKRLGFLASQLVAIVSSPDEDAWVLAAAAAATPYLFFERRDIWDRLAGRVLCGDGGAVSARALARGLVTLWRRGHYEPEVEQPLRELRERARRAPAAGFDDLRRWIEVIAVTDVVDSAERDPLDLELGVDNLMRIGAQYDDEEADARAARFAGSVLPTFNDALRIALGSSRPRQRAAALNALEGCARVFALRLWGPLLATSPGGDPIDEPDLEETWKVIAGTPAEILDLVKERRQTEGADLHVDVPLEALAVRLGGYALDACGQDADLGPGRGPTAHETCHWLRKLDGLADGTRELPRPLKTALSAIFWRLVDTTRGTTLGLGDDVAWLGPFAAWWGLVIDRPAMLQQLATALPMMAEGVLDHCIEQAEALRSAVSSGAEDGQWGPETATALEALRAQDTELAQALAGLAVALAGFADAAGPQSELEAMCVALVLAADRLQAALADPVKALHPPADEGADDSLAQRSTENAPRVASLVARAIRGRQIQMVDVWLAALGPVASALLEASIRAAIRRTPPPPPTKKKAEPKLVEGYEMIKRLGEGGIGSVWLVRKPGADRFFVLKIPKADALENANDAEREQILASFVEEAAALAGLYHPNVANIIDRGVSSDMPFLVLEYLIGADLRMYADARHMTLFELRQVVLDSCAGLSALHNAGLVHRDIKPGNLWLRLPLQGGVRFDPSKHRDPALAPPLATVVIDFGMVRATRVAAETGGRFVAGTAGYIAPEQVLDPVELDPRADVYSLAATIYNVTTGRAFFDEIDNNRDRIIAHMRRDPFEEAERLKVYPAAIAKLMRAATAKKPTNRPMPMEFGREFAAAL